MSESLTRSIAELKSRLILLPEAEKPPPTTLQIIGRSHQERDWQQLLFHFLSPGEAHGLEYALVEHLLVGLSARDDFDYTFSRFDLTDIQIEQEVITSNGRRPDAVVWSSEDWFICWELKVGSSEGEDQTQDYVDADSFQSIGLDKSDVPRGEHHYVYLAPDDAPPPEASEFVPISWNWVASELQSFLVNSHGEYPARTTAQLDDFIETIRSELTMTEYQENQQEKVELYLDYYDEISEVQQAFTSEWEGFTASWGDRLARTLEAASIVEDPNVPEEYASVELKMENGDQQLWIFRQSESDWSWMFPREWWTNFGDNQPIYIYDPSSPQARVGFLHRLDWNQEEALRDHELVFYLRNAPAGHDDFYAGFAERFNADEEVPALLPTATTRPGVKSNVFEATYDINVESHDDFFDAYIDALAQAIEDHIVSNPELVYKIDSIYEETIKEDTPF